MSDSSLVQNIISKCGGASALAELLNYPRSTVNNWVNRKTIPSKQQNAILSAALKSGIDLKPEDFFEISPPGKKRNGHKNGAA